LPRQCDLGGAPGDLWRAAKISPLAEHLCDKHRSFSPRGPLRDCPCLSICVVRMARNRRIPVSPGASGRAAQDISPGVRRADGPERQRPTDARVKGFGVFRLWEECAAADDKVGAALMARRGFRSYGSPSCRNFASAKCPVSGSICFRWDAGYRLPDMRPRPA
jgi:hypothetical protein